MKLPLPKPPSKLPPKGGPMSPPPVRAAAPRPPLAPPGPAPAPRPAAPGRPGLPLSAPARAAAGSPGATAQRGTAPFVSARGVRVAAAGATGSVGSVMEAVKLVDDVLVEENQVLRRHDAKAAAALQERKLAATRLYHERMRALLKDAEAVRAMPPEQRMALTALAHGLDERVRENAILLKATMDSIDRLFAAINTAAQQKNHREVAYSRAGVVAGPASPVAASIAFNRTV